MNAKEKTYMMALAALLLIGLSTAWAGYNATATISGTINDFASVSPKNPAPTLNNLKKSTWFKTSEQTIFTIDNVNVTSIFVRITLLNMPELVDDFRSLDINVTLYKGTTKKDSGIISLETGAASVLLYADKLSASADDLTVNATIYGYTSSKVKVGSSVSLTFVCTVEPAEAVNA
jgi:hypothetical protein